MAAPLLVAQQTPPNGKLLQPRTDTLVAFMLRGADTVAMGHIIDELRVQSDGGEQRLIRVYRTISQRFGNAVDTLIDEASTLAPRSQRSRRPMGTELVDFHDGRAVGLTVSRRGDSARVDAAVPTSAYAGSSFDLLLRSSPLSVGWSATFPAFVTSSRSVVELTANVVGIEDIDGEPCWHVEAMFQETPVGFWISQRSRRLCRQEIRFRGGATMLFVRHRWG
jgi:hypothetical protein